MSHRPAPSHINTLGNAESARGKKTPIRTKFQTRKKEYFTEEENTHQTIQIAPIPLKRQREAYTRNTHKRHTDATIKRQSPRKKVDAAAKRETSSEIRDS